MQPRSSPLGGAAAGDGFRFRDRRFFRDRSPLVRLVRVDAHLAQDAPVDGGRDAAVGVENLETIQANVGVELKGVSRS